MCDCSLLKNNSLPTSRIPVQVPVGIERADVFVDTPTEVHGSRGVVLPCSSMQQHSLAPIQRVTPQAISHLYTLLLERSSSNSSVSASELRAWTLHWSGVPDVKYVMCFSDISGCMANHLCRTGPTCSSTCALRSSSRQHRSFASQVQTGCCAG